MSDKSAKALQVNNTVSSRFTNMVVKEFSGAIGEAVKFTPYQKKLTQHLFVKIDAQLKDLEAKRLKENRKVAPYEWGNVNMEKLAIDAVHRIDLGLDALIPNHISPIPYWNGKKQAYDLDLRVGYEGKDYYRRKMAMDEPKQIIYELVYSNDEFTVIKQDKNQEADAYEFSISQPFDRGEIIGGFGYIIFGDPSKNELVLVSEAEFVKSKNSARSKDFWNKHPEKMRMKTLVHRTTEKLKLDPEKVNASFYMVNNEVNEREALSMLTPDGQVQAEINYNANQQLIDITPENIPSNDVKKQEPAPNEVPGPSGMTDAEKAEVLAQEQAEAESQMQGGPDF